MRSLVKLSLVAAVPLVGAMPALAQKAGGQKQVKAAPADRIPSGILLALQRASPTVGHGADVPRGKGKGWGHLLHQHDDVPVSP